MSEDTLKELRIALFDEEISKHHIGLKNCHLKLKLLYGPKYGITRIDSSPSGTCIKLLIPQYVYPYADVSQEEE